MADKLTLTEGERKLIESLRKYALYDQFYNFALLHEAATVFVGEGGEVGWGDEVYFAFLELREEFIANLAVIYARRIAMRLQHEKAQALRLSEGDE